VLRAALRAGKKVRGVFVKLGSTEVVDLVAGAGFDFLVVDLEHSQLSESQALALLRHAHALALPAVVRIPSLEHGLINRCLEAGAEGIQLSMVRRAEQVRGLVAATRYPPHGSRSVSLAHPVAGYGTRSLADYLAEQAHSPPLVVAQIETATTDDPLDAIIAAGVDVLFIGTTDLNVDLGLNQEAAAARIAEIGDATEGSGAVLGGFGVEDPRLLYDASVSDVAALRAGLDARSASL
jgi:4-hydroxy-2-oxoheptanedioate aldolase